MLLYSWDLSLLCSAREQSCCAEAAAPSPSLPEQSEAKPPWCSRRADLQLGQQGRSRSSDAPPGITFPRFPHSGSIHSASRSCREARPGQGWGGQAGAGLGRPQVGRGAGAAAAGGSCERLLRRFPPPRALRPGFETGGARKS